MKVRDEHMRKYIFRTVGGEEPGLHFASDSGVCENAGKTHEYRCAIRGAMSIRGVSQPTEIVLQVKEDSGDVFHVVADQVVRLSAYSIPQPSQFGVKPADEVK